jgi:hypothetical protein
MASRDDLTPALTVDKNGKQTTVYRRSNQSSVVASSFSIPTVSMPSSAREALVRETALALASAANAPEFSLRAVTKDVDRCSDELIEHVGEVIRSIEDAKVRKKVAIRIALQLMRKPKGKKSGAAHEEEISEAMDLYPVIPDSGSDIARKIIESVRHLPQFSGMPNLRDASEDEKKTCHALARVINAALLASFLDRRSDSYLFEDERITDLVLEYPDHSHLIAEVIRARHTLDPVLLRDMVESEASSLGSGIL